MTREECPICGIMVKETNMPSHLRRVHPASESAETYARMFEKSLRKRSPHPPMAAGVKKAVTAIVIISVIISSAVLLYMWYMGLDHPRIKVIPTAYDFGNVPRGVSTATFEIWNVGEADLELRGASTSCSCTSAVFEVDGVSSPVFGMHNNPSDWSATLYPGESAILKVSYDSSLHPDSGHVRRAVYIRSNDPFNPEYQIDITANVIP